MDQEMAFKTNWLSNNIDGSEDHLVSSRIMNLVGDDFRRWRDEELVTGELPANLKDLMASLTPPEGIRRGDLNEPRDRDYMYYNGEGAELLDGDGEDDVEPEVIYNFLSLINHLINKIHT